LSKDNKKLRIFSLILKIFAIFIALSLLIIIISLGVIMHLNSPPQNENFSFSEQDGIIRNEDSSYQIEVRKGESARSVGTRLERAGLIKNRYFWQLICRFGDNFLKNGTYRLEIPATQIAIYRILISGRQILHRVTVPEGATLKKAAKIFEEAGICSSDEFLAASRDTAIINSYRIPGSSMEGYLFPDTYMFPAEYPADMVVKALADNFFSRIENINPSVHSMSSKELYEKVIMASIVEREYRLEEEAPVMAGVFYNRINIGMALQSCATVEYIITEILDKPHPTVILNRDLEIRDPYNTYLVPGLPPGPISAPGTIALEAAFSPEITEFLYFRLDDPQSGRHYFSRTFDEHIRAGQLLPKGSS